MPDRSGDLLNRPLLASDLGEVEANQWARTIRELVLRYRNLQLPVMNGGFGYSNLLEGPSQVLTCSPYRLWEYSSLFLGLDGASKKDLVLDVGGAAAPLAYVLAENGYRVMTIDLQPLLVAVAQHVASRLSLTLDARVADVVTDLRELTGSVGTVAFVSVLEHIPRGERRKVLQAFFDLLQPGGLLYMTFDYGDYGDVDGYVQPGREEQASRSIDDVAALADELQSIGFRFRGNDPRELPEEMLRQRSAPGARIVHRRLAALSRPMDADTPWSTVAKYLLKRVLRYSPRAQSRFDRHNFFRMYLEKP